MDDRVAKILGHACESFHRAGIPYLLIGGIASSVYGRPRTTDDIDLLVDPNEALRGLETLGAAGFDTEETNPHWIYKATSDGTTIDLMFKVHGDIYLDEEMVERGREIEVSGRTVRVASPEDVLTIKAVAHDEPSFRHWHDALAILAVQELDWEYVLRRARHGAHRVLSLLVYAQSNDLIVPEHAIRELFAQIYDAAPATAG